MSNTINDCILNRYILDYGVKNMTRRIFKELVEYDIMILDINLGENSHEYNILHALDVRDETYKPLFWNEITETITFEGRVMREFKMEDGVTSFSNHLMICFNPNYKWQYEILESYQLIQT